MQTTIRRPWTLIGVGVGGLLLLRTAAEWAMMREYGPDAQPAIWRMFMVASLAVWFVAGVVCGLLSGFPKNARLRRFGVCLLVVWSVAVAYSSFEYLRGRQALADASNPATAPDRLDALADFNGIQVGYELDNRIALNRNTPLETLRKLHARNQLGTNTCLQRNPNTPQDVGKSCGLLDVADRAERASDVDTRGAIEVAICDLKAETTHSDVSAPKGPVSLATGASPWYPVRRLIKSPGRATHSTVSPRRIVRRIRFRDEAIAPRTLP